MILRRGGKRPTHDPEKRYLSWGGETGRWGSVSPVCKRSSDPNGT